MRPEARLLVLLCLAGCAAAPPSARPDPARRPAPLRLGDTLATSSLDVLPALDVDLATLGPVVQDAWAAAGEALAVELPRLPPDSSAEWLQHELLPVVLHRAVLSQRAMAVAKLAEHGGLRQRMVALALMGLVSENLLAGVYTMSWQASGEIQRGLIDLFSREGSGYTDLRNRLLSSYEGCAETARAGPASLRLWASWCGARADSIRQEEETWDRPPSTAPACAAARKARPPPGDAETRLAVLLMRAPDAPVTLSELEPAREAAAAVLSEAKGLPLIPLDVVREAERRVVDPRGADGRTACAAEGDIGLTLPNSGPRVAAVVVADCDARRSCELVADLYGVSGDSRYRAPVESPERPEAWAAAGRALAAGASALAGDTSPGYAGDGVAIPEIGVFGFDDPEGAATTVRALRPRLAACSSRAPRSGVGGSFVLEVSPRGRAREIADEVSHESLRPLQRCLADALERAVFTSAPRTTRRRIALGVTMGEADPAISVRVCNPRSEDSALAGHGPSDADLIGVGRCYRDTFGPEARDEAFVYYSLDVGPGGDVREARAWALRVPMVEHVEQDAMPGVTSPAFEACVRAALRTLPWPCTASGQTARVEGELRVGRGASP